MRFRGIVLGAFLAWLSSLCMCSSPMSRPPVLGNCDGGCDPSTGSGSVSPPTGGTVFDAGSGTTTDAEICGIADSHVNTSDTLCAPCIIQNCCPQDTACTDNCTSVLDCAEGCAAGDTLCVGNCENLFAAGVGAYQAFALCLQTSCMNTCPALQQ